MRSRPRSASRTALAERRERWRHDDGTPLEDLREGLWYEGVISYSGVRGVFVDIGAVWDARLQVGPKHHRFLTLGTGVQVYLAEKNVEAQTIEVSMDEEDFSKLAQLHKSNTDGLESRGKAKGKGKSKEKGMGKASARTSLADLQSQVGDIIKGVVKTVNKYGVFVDISAHGDARLQAPRSVLNQMHEGLNLDNLHLDWIDEDRHRIQVSLCDEALSQHTPRFNWQHSSKTQHPGTRGGRSSADWYSDVHVGMLVNGFVKSKTRKAVWVDIGSFTQACLLVKEELLSEFQVGDEILGMQVEEVDRYKNKITVSIEDPELEPADMLQRSPAKEGKARASSRPLSSSRSMASEGSSRKEAPQISTARSATKGAAQSSSNSSHPIGSILDGVITRVTAKSVFVCLDSGEEARLDVPVSLRRQFQKQDRICGMRVEEVDHNGKFILSLDDPYLEVEAEPPSETKAESTRPRQPSRNSANQVSWPQPSPRPQSRDRRPGSIAGSGSRMDASPAMPQRGVASRALPQRGPSSPQTPPWSHLTATSTPSTPSRGRAIQPSTGTSSPNLEVSPHSAARQHTGLKATASDQTSRRLPKSKAKATGPERHMDHPEGTPLERFTVGEEVTGLVTRLDGHVYLHIGAIVDGLLRLPARDAKKLQLGDQVEGALIESIDLQKLQLTLSLPYELGEPMTAYPY